jgi:hypothetical protein
MGSGIDGNLLRRALGDDLAAAVSALRAEVDDPVGGFDDIEIVFDDHHGIAVIAQLMQDSEQMVDVVEVQAGGRLVEDSFESFTRCASPPESVVADCPSLM